MITGSIGKVAKDLLVLSQNEISEIQFNKSGISSSMRHKNNPIIAELLVALSKLNASLDIYNHFLKHGFKESDVEHIIKALEYNVESYHDHQTRTAEILNILQGYKNIKDGSVQPPEPEEIAKQSE